MIQEKPKIDWPTNTDIAPFFKEKVSPLLRNVSSNDLDKIYTVALKKIRKKSVVNEFFIQRKKCAIKRSIFVFPKEKKIYITLRWFDIKSIRSKLDKATEPGPLYASIGIYGKHFFGKQKGSKKVCSPLLELSLSLPCRAFLTCKLKTKIYNHNFEKYQKKLEGIHREIKFRTQFNENPNIVTLKHHMFYYKKDCFDVKEIKHLEISEYCHGDLFTWYLEYKRNKPKEEELQKIIGDVAFAISEMHAQDILHGDIKLENILVQIQKDRTIRYKLCDFGHTREIKTNNNITGTPSHMSPERIKYYCHLKDDLETGSDKPDDVWALGIVLYKLINMKEPNWADLSYTIMKKVSRLVSYEITLSEGVFSSYLEEDTLLEKILELETQISRLYNKYITQIKKFLIYKKFPEDTLAAKIMEGCLTFDPRKRFTFEEIQSLLIEK